MKKKKKKKSSGTTLVTLLLIALMATTAVAGIFFGDGEPQDATIWGEAGREIPREEDLIKQAEAEAAAAAKEAAKAEAEAKKKSEEEAKNKGELPSEEDSKEEEPKDPQQQLMEDFAKEKEEYYLLLANPDNALPSDFAPTTEEVQNGYKMDSRVAPAAREMIKAAKEDGVDLLMCSAYRPIAKQQKLFDEMMQGYIAGGMSEQEAYAKTATAIAIPGTSEHQTGLAADIVTPLHQTLDPEFADTAAGQWLINNAHKYGFVLRYPEDKQDKTKIIYESWHFRFVGKTHAKIMKEMNLCLEEYLELELPDGYTGIKDPYEAP